MAVATDCQETWNARDHMPRERTYLRYQVYRSEARKRAASQIAGLQGQLKAADASIMDLSLIRFEPINRHALNVFETWEEPCFFWHEVIAWKSREPRALDISIWFAGQLCGLCFANPNNSRRRLRVVRLEGRPGGTHPLKNRIGLLAMMVIEQYAHFVGCDVIEIQEPLDGAIPVYQKLGFSFDI